MAFLIAVSFVGSLVSMALPAPWIALLGIVPLALGIKKLRDSGRRRETDARPPSVGSTVVAIAGVTVANGGDNLGIYIPYFASLRVWETLLVVAVFMTMIAVWCIAAMWLMGHRRISRFVERFSHVMLPIVLIGLGLWILSGALPLIFEIERSITSVR